MIVCVCVCVCVCMCVCVCVCAFLEKWVYVLFNVSCLSFFLLIYTKSKMCHRIDIVEVLKEFDERVTCKLCTN